MYNITVYLTNGEISHFVSPTLATAQEDANLMVTRGLITDKEQTIEYHPSSSIFKVVIDTKKLIGHQKN